MKTQPLNFKQTRAGGHRAVLAKPVRRPVLVTMGLTLPTGYLERFCRYARPINPAQPPTFLNTLYAPEPPGIRVGPWPGWRGIPDLPQVRLHTGRELVVGKYYFLGDEELGGELRVMFSCQQGLGKILRFESDDAQLDPQRAQLRHHLPSWAPPRPVTLRPELCSQHPRLLLDATGVERLRCEIRGVKEPHWRRLRGLVRTAWRLPYATTPEVKVLPGAERLTGADRTLVAACIALLRPTPENCRRARRAFFAYLRETARPDFGPLGIDTQSGEVLYVLCVAFDWLHDSFSAAQRRQARARLGEIAAICRRHLDPARRDYAQAHYLGCGLGLLAYALLFWEEEPAAPAWAAELRGAFDRVLTMLPADGFFPHGINLWIYEHGFLLRWVELFRQCTGEDLWRSTPYWANAARFRAATTSPDGRHGVTFGDPQYRVTGESWCHLLIARQTGSPVAQALGEQLLEQLPVGTDHRHAPPRRRVYELLWHDGGIRPSVEVQEVSWFPDGGQVLVRRNDTLVTLRSGAPLGAQRRAAGEPGGYGHSDPCNGAILVWRGGTFVGSGPGPLYRRDTALHNLVTIDGRGQVGDSCVWFPDVLDETKIPPVPTVKQRGEVVRIRCELARAYLPHLDVIRHTRRLAVGAEGTLAGEDEIVLKQSREIAWHWHTWAGVQSAGSALILSGPGCRGRLELEAVAGTRWRVEPERFVAAYPHEGTVGTAISATRTARRTVFRWQLRFE
jgi:hypothetical protein